MCNTIDMCRCLSIWIVLSPLGGLPIRLSLEACGQSMRHANAAQMFPCELMLSVLLVFHWPRPRKRLTSSTITRISESSSLTIFGVSKWDDSDPKTLIRGRKAGDIGFLIEKYRCDGYARFGTVHQRSSNKSCRLPNF